MSVEWCERIEPIASEWDRLADEAGAPPWLRPGWVAAWWHAFGRGTLTILAVRTGGALTGVVPLRRLHGVLATPTNWHSPGSGLLAASGGDAERLAHAVATAGGRRLSVTFVDRNGWGLNECCQAARGSGYRILIRGYQRSPYVEMASSFQAYLGSRASKALRELRRRRRRLAENGTLSFEVSDGSRELARSLEDAFRIEALGWKGQRGTAIKSHAHTQRFYADIARWASNRGALRLLFLRLDGRSIAFRLTFEEAGHQYSLKLGHDPAYARYSPGMLLTYDLLERAHAVGLRTVEFLGAEEPWKAVWADDVRERVLLQAFSRSLTGTVDRAAFEYGRPVAKRLIAGLAPRPGQATKVDDPSRMTSR